MAAVAHDEAAQDDEDIVVIDNVHKTYLLGIEGVPALRGVSLTIKRGEWVVIYGTSGGGKTTMLNIIGTIDKPSKGEMRIAGMTVNPDTGDDVLAKIRLSTLGFVFQTFNLLSSMTARENVELPMILKGEKSAAERKAIAISSLERMGLGHRLEHTPNMLSGGEQQRVTIARAIANRPKLLLLDEPTGDLDSHNTRQVIRLLRELNEEHGMTLVMVTHDMYLKNFATRVVWMRDGKIVKTESISKSNRMDAFADLEEQDRLAKLAAQEQAANNLSSTATSSSSSSTPAPVSWTHTEVRQLTDYKMLAFQKDHERLAQKSTMKQPAPKA